MTDNRQTSENAPVRETKGFITKSCIIPGRLDGKLAIVTGSNTGIGAVTAAELARRGCCVVMACRNLEKAEQAKENILKKFGSGNPDSTKLEVADESVRAYLKPINEDQLIVEKLDLGSFKSIREFAARISQTHPKVDFLINNAGMAPAQFGKTEDGLEQVMAVNHVGPFLLTELLLPNVKSAAPSRIINVASIGHRFASLRKPDLFRTEETYDNDMTYMESKLANVMHARQLAKRLEGSGVIALSLHPGAIASDFFREYNTLRRRILYGVIKPFLINTWQGAQTTLYTVLSKNTIPGGYYSNCALTQPTTAARNDEDCQWLWEKTEQIIAGVDNVSSSP